jgi:phytoene synthase
MPDAFDHCEALVREADKDRFVATLFAPAKFRRPLFALYAFNIEIARVRELAREPMPGEIRLQWWRDAFAGVGRGDVRANPVAAALLDTVVRYRLPPRALDDLMASVAELEGYVAKTSGALIELAATILNAGTDAGITPLATHAGAAYAIAGLLAAFPVHSARRQFYVPLDLLARHGARAEDVFGGKATPELRATLADLRSQARRHLQEARALLGSAPEMAAPALLPAALARPLLDRMERRRYDPFTPVSLAPWRRQWIIWRAARKGLAPAL